MEKYTTYNTKELLNDYEQWLKGFRFMTDEKIAAYMDYVKLLSVMPWTSSLPRI